MHAVALAEHRNFARAAKALHLSQPALTRSIQVLEERMGVLLFERKRSGVVPTDAGQITLRRAQAIVGQTNDLLREVGGIDRKDQEEIRISAGPYPAGMILSSAIASMLKKKTNLRFKVEVDHWVEAIEKLRERQVDFALCEASEVNDSLLKKMPLLRHTARPAVRDGHPLLQSNATSLEQVMKWPLAITARLPPRISENLTVAANSISGFEPAVHCEDTGFLKSLVLSSDAVGFFPPAMIEKELTSRLLHTLDIDQPWLVTNFNLFHLKARSPSPVALEFIEELKLADEQVAAKNQRLAEFSAR